MHTGGRRRYAIRWPGAAMLSPPTTGPTGTNGGAKVGIGPLPMTSITCCIGSHIRNASESTVAMASCSAWYCLSGSLSFMLESSASSIALVMSSGMMMLVIFDETQVMSGIGTFGIGGAIGPGNAANAGYQGSPGTITWPCQSLKHLETPLATASRCFFMLPKNDATIGAFLMLLSSSGPSRHPGEPMAQTAITCKSLNFACSFHMLWLYWTASIIASWKSLKFWPILSQLFWCGLKPASRGMNQGGITSGAPPMSALSRSLWYFDAQASFAGSAFPCVGSFRPAEKNLRLPRILIGLRPGIRLPRRYATAS